MIKTPLKVGIVGTGRFGSRHLEKWLKIEDVELIGFNDKDDKICKEIDDKFGLPCFPLEELIGSVDILDIVVPISSHYTIAKKALKAGKHIFVEKSFTEFPDQAYELKELAVKSSLKVGIGHIERFNPVLVELKKQLTATPSKLMAFRQGPFIPEVGLDVSIIKELMIHDIDLITHFIPSPIKSIQAQGEIIHSDKIDRVTAIINFESGSEAILFASRAEDERRREVLCTDGNIEYKADLMNRKLSSSKSPDVRSFEFADAMLDELTAFAKAVRSGEKYIVNEDTGCVTMEIAQQIEDIIGQ